MNERPNNRSMLERRLFVAGLAGSVDPAARPRAVRCDPSPDPRSVLPPQSGGAAARNRRRPVDRGRRSRADEGRTAVPHGRVVDRRGAAMANAAVEIWQCDANAVYHHPDGGAESQRDPASRVTASRGQAAAGDFHFRTIRPVAYPGRTPHIHIRVQTSGRTGPGDAALPPERGGQPQRLPVPAANADEQAALTLALRPGDAGRASARTRHPADGARRTGRRRSSRRASGMPPGRAASLSAHRPRGPSAASRCSDGWTATPEARCLPPCPSSATA